jgi:hypothetical protein
VDNLVVLHNGQALDLLGVLLKLLRLPRLLRLLGDQLLQVLHLVLQICGLSLDRLELLMSLVQLSLEVVDIALGGGQLMSQVRVSSRWLVLRSRQ